MTDKNSASSLPAFKVPILAQLGLGLFVVFLVYWVSVRSNSFVSAWSEEDSNFYESASEALKHRSVNPTAPTAFIFWKQDCEPCIKNIRFLNRFPGNVRIYGIHLTLDAESEFEIRKSWYQESPKSANLLIDQNDFLQTSFKVKSVPDTFIVLPKQKKIWTYYGDLEKSEKQMLQILATE